MDPPSVFSYITFVLLFVILGVLGYLFYRLVTLSIKLNDYKYYLQRPQIPFENKNTFEYTINTPSKNLL